MRVAAILFFVFLHAIAHSQEADVVVEEFFVHDGSIAELSGMITYRVYLEMPANSFVLEYLYGSEDLPLLINSSGGFYQHPLGSNFGWEILPLSLIHI